MPLELDSPDFAGSNLGLESHLHNFCSPWIPSTLLQTPLSEYIALKVQYTMSCIVNGLWVDYEHVCPTMYAVINLPVTILILPLLAPSTLLLGVTVYS